MQMVVGFFTGDGGDYSGVGTLLTRLSAQYPKTWFYTVDVSSEAAQVNLMLNSCLRVK